MMDCRRCAKNSGCKLRGERDRVKRYFPKNLTNRTRCLVILQAISGQRPVTATFNMERRTVRCFKKRVN